MFTDIWFFLKTTWKIDKKSVAFCVIYNLLKQLLNVFYGVYFLRMILVAIETGEDMGAVLKVLGIMFSISFAFYFCNSYFKEVYLPCFETKLVRYMKEECLKASSSVDYDRYNSPEFLNLYNRILDNSGPNMMKMLNAIGTMCGLVEAFVLAAVYVVRIDVFAVFLVVIPLAYTYFVGVKAEKQKQKLDKELAGAVRKKEYARRIFYLPQYAKEIRMTGISEVIKGIFTEGVSESISLVRKFGKGIAILHFIELLVGDVLSIMLPVAYVAIRMKTGVPYMIGDFIGIAQAISTFDWDIEWFFDECINIKSASLYVHEFREFCADYEEKQEEGMDIEKNVPFTISCENAAYAYPGMEEGNYALHDINVTIQSGERIAVVGENGAGKTTLVSLLMHLTSCTKGKMKLNGVEIEKYSSRALKDFYGVVMQDFHLYPVSVRENICMDKEISDEKIWHALKMMQLDGKVCSLDMQVTREFSDEGLELSGGEKQRMALARVVANENAFIILDEPTSALDPITERDINRLIMNALPAANRALLMISHKLSTARLADRILVVKDGTIVEDGNHDQLMEEKGTYYEMYTMQQQMYKEKFNEA